MSDTTRDWAVDYDIFDPAYIADPFPIWDELRGACPVAHSERYGGTWLRPGRTFGAAVVDAATGDFRVGPLPPGPATVVFVRVPRLYIRLSSSSG